MEETKIWSVDDNGTSATRLDTVNQMETEPLLENLLTANPDMLEDGLQLVGRQTSTAGGPLDLLGVDTDGRLVVYELKRGRLNRDAVAQVIDYASSLNAMDEEALYRHISERSGNLGIQKIDNFGEWYSNNWSDEGSEALMPPRMVLVGLGVDDTTERMVNYMATIGMDISLLTFHGFTNTDGEILLARNVEVERSDEAVSPPRKPRSYNRRARFEENLRTLPEDMRSIIDDVERMFRSVRNRFTNIYASRRKSFMMDFSWSEEYAWDDTTRAGRRFMTFVEIGESKNHINVGYSWIAVRLAHEEFRKITNEDVRDNYMFPIHSLEEWDARKEELTALTQKVCKAYDAAREQALSSQ